MKTRKIIIFILTFLCLLVQAAMVSNIQSTQADLILDSNGMSSQSSQLSTRKNIKVASLLKYLTENFDQQPVQLQLQSKTQTDQILVWANQSVRTLPVEKGGRYFSISDFQGVVSTAVLAPDSLVSRYQAGSTNYVVLDQRYYTVVGTLKQNSNQAQTQYYLTTGIDQPTGKRRLANYKIYIDGLKKAEIAKLASYLHSSVKTPSFVTKHQQHHRAISILEMMVVLVLVLINCVLAWLMVTIDFRMQELGQLPKRLMLNLIANKSLRYLLVEVVLALAAYLLMQFKAYFTNESVLAWIYLADLTTQMAIYLWATFKFGKEHRHG